MTSAKAVSITKPLVQGVETADEFLAYVARVSNPSNQLNNETAPRLIGYLMKNSHWSPFEMVHVTMELRTTRDIGRQVLRHKSFSFQEFSQRYSAVTDFAKPREARLQDRKNRQGSIEISESYQFGNHVDKFGDKAGLKEVWWEMQDDLIAAADHAYTWALDNGIAKEVARSVLPEGLTMSTMYMSGSLRSWIHYCDLRTGNGTQKEHRELAEAAWAEISMLFPSVARARDEMLAPTPAPLPTRTPADVLLDAAMEGKYPLTS